MIPAAFDYLRPTTVEEAVASLAAHADAKVLAGGHSLLPAMKLRLAQPRTVIDIGRIAELNFLHERNGRIALGAMLTHAQIEESAFLRDRCPLLPAVAAQIGDVQVRNRGTIGGSLVHADPAADWPAAILALEAELELAGPQGRRVVKAADFFVEMMQTAVHEQELLCEIRVPGTGASVAYAKFAQKASGFAIAGVAVVLDKKAKSARVAITGAAPRPYRATAVEAALEGKALTPENIASAAAHAADDVETLNDIHASAEFRAHLAIVNTQRALTAAARS